MCSRSPSMIAAAGDGTAKALPVDVIGGSRSNSPSVLRVRLSAMGRVSSSGTVRSEHHGRCSYFELRPAPVSS